MNEKINEDIKSLKFIFNKNKHYIFPIVIILISVMLFFQFVIPQMKTLIVIRKESKEASLKLETLKTNLEVLNNINEDIVDSQLKVLNLALPPNKDFIGILNSLDFTANRTAVILGNFSLKIGDLSGTESSGDFSVVKLTVPISAGVTNINNFIETIGKTVPLSEIDFVKIGNPSSMVNLTFYYSPLNVSNYNQYVRIIPISQKGLTLIDQLNKFENIPSFAQ